MKTAGLYIHIPYCARKCSYCDFSSIKLDSSVDRYIDCLETELRINSHLLKDFAIDTIFIGGGTPTSIESKHISGLMKTVYEYYNVNLRAEITIEANPGTVDRGKAENYLKAGINRISLGIQSFDDRMLKSIGRIHTGDEAVDTVKLLKECGIDNLNGDIMFGLPGQTLEKFLSDINTASDLGLQHISMYGLIIEENTLLNSWYKKGLLEIPCEALERLMYHRGKELLKKKGYIQYEISNFSKKGRECRHNIGYWKLKPYLGAGLSAHSNIGNKRFWNTNSFETYFQLLESGITAIGGEEVLDLETRAGEYLILGIRLTEGVLFNEFSHMFGFRVEEKYKETIQKHTTTGLLEMSDNGMWLSDRGMDLSNQVEVDFLP